MFLEIQTKKLISAISEEDLEGIKKILTDLKNEGTQEDISQVVNFPLGAFGMRAMHLAAFRNNVELVKLLLENGSHADAADRLGRTPLHFASEMGSPEILDLLIKNGAYVNARYGVTTWSKLQGHEILDEIPLPTIFGRTPLHAATSNLHYECTRILLENQADPNIEDDESQTPLLTTGENLKSDSKMFKAQFEAIVDLLLQHGAQIHFLNSATYKGIIHRALEFNSLKICKELIKLGYDVTSVDTNGDTILHESCKMGNSEFTQEIINSTKKIVNQPNKKHETPLHLAAYSASKYCLVLLLNNGGDLSKTTTFGQSVIDAILSSVPRPTNFLLKILDSKIIPNRSSVNEKYFNVTLDYQILTPNKDRQMSVVTSLIKSLNFDQKPKILLHPLIESFIRLKWSHLRVFFFFLVILHFFFVISLSMYVVFLLDSGTKDFLDWSRIVLLSTGTVLLIHIMTEISLAPKYYLKEYETWLTITCVSLALAMGIWEAYEMKGGELPIWIRHMAAYDVLLSWTLMMFVLGRFPFVGYFALMFSTVLRNVLKVLLFFACLVIGFSLSFCIQFNDSHFDDPWKSFVRTTVMLMGEFEYTDIFKENEEKDKIGTRFQSVSNTLEVTSRIIFLLFVLLGSIVLMNLMTGLAVNDIQGIRAEGCVRHIIKQAEFISHVEKILSKDKLRFLPEKIKLFICERKTLPDLIIFEPHTLQRTSYGNKCKNQIKNNISFKLMESIMLVAVENQKNALKNKMEADYLNDDRDEKDNHEWIDLNIEKTMNEIKSELEVLSSKLDEFMKNYESKAKDI